MRRTPLALALALAVGCAEPGPTARTPALAGERAAAVAAPPLPADSPWRVPSEGECEATRRGGPDDAVPGVPAPGETITQERAHRLKDFVPPEIWEHRERFFYDGMRLEIGPCHRDYGPPDFYVSATLEHAPTVRLAPDGALLGHRAGLPFPPHALAGNDPRAAQKWAWNWVLRYGAAGGFGDHRLSIVNDRGVAEQWRGDHFFVRLAGRADRPHEGYRHETKFDATWAAGGSTRNLQTGQVCAFRQYGSEERRADYFVGSSYTRKVRRAPPPETDGPLTACLADATIGAGLFVHGGLPAQHDWELVAVRDLLAPINAARNTWPVERNRSYGPWGISFADERWELRRALVLAGARREGRYQDGTTRFVWYLDLQTLVPLYYAGYRADGSVAGIGYWLYRFSEDRPRYPGWPDDRARPVRVLDSVGAAFVSWNDTHAVRIETGNEVGVPPEDGVLNRRLATSSIRLR